MNHAKQRLPADITDALQALDTGVSKLRRAAKPYSPNLKFTLDGRLIGDIGELLAAKEFGITIQSKQNTGYDGIDEKDRHVEIKTTRLNSFAFRKISERVICIKLHDCTHWQVIYNGPGSNLAKLFALDHFVNQSRKITRRFPASLRSQRQLSISSILAVSSTS
ncbi:MAG: hypothetical protein KF712_03165 [Akkermansiaceae bacterium]|nr:hypothetical protein [Akkermansiaceae bacterium]